VGRKPTFARTNNIPPREKIPFHGTESFIAVLMGVQNLDPIPETEDFSSHPHYPPTPRSFKSSSPFRLTKICHVEFEVLMLVIMINTILWNVTPSSSLKFNRCFGVTCCLQLQGQEISQARPASYVLHAGFLLG
jgi:hypothetical protein